jgi:hypothetical protein
MLRVERAEPQRNATGDGERRSRRLHQQDHEQHEGDEQKRETAFR